MAILAKNNYLMQKLRLFKSQEQGEFNQTIEPVVIRKIMMKNRIPIKMRNIKTGSFVYWFLGTELNLKELSN